MDIESVSDRPRVVVYDASTGITIERDATADEILFYASLELIETPGERSASDNVEEEGSPNDPMADSSGAPSDN